MNSSYWVFALLCGGVIERSREEATGMQKGYIPLKEGGEKATSHSPSQVFPTYHHPGCPHSQPSEQWRLVLPFLGHQGMKGPAQAPCRTGPGCEDKGMRQEQKMLEPLPTARSFSTEFDSPAAAS